MPFYLSFSLLWRSATFETFPLFLVDIFLFFHRLFSFYLTVRVSICSISSSNTFIVEVISSMKGNVITKVVQPWTVPLNVYFFLQIFGEYIYIYWLTYYTYSSKLLLNRASIDIYFYLLKSSNKQKRSSNNDTLKEGLFFFGHFFAC